MLHTLNYNQHRICYRKAGKGPVVVLLHGFGEDGEIWNNQIVALEKNFTVITPDLSGSGKSELIDDISMESLADVVKAIADDVFDRESKYQFALIGHSMGGYIALAFAEKYPTLLNGLGLFHSTAYADSEEKKEKRRKSIKFINENGAFEFLKTAIPDLFSTLTKETNPQLIENLVKRGEEFSSAALVRYYEAMIKRPARGVVLKTDRWPVLFVMGKYDQAVAPGDSLELCRLPEIVYIHQLKKSAHLGMIEEPEKSVALLENFLQYIQ